MDCIFCKIIKGEIPCDKVYEDEKTLAFLDISPVNKGHTLVVPKHHCKDILEAPDEELKQTILTVKKVAKAMVKAVNANGWNLGVNNGEAAGQVVFHSHFHIIPRLSTDGLKHWPHKNYSAGESKKVAAQIRKVL